MNTPLSPAAIERLLSKLRDELSPTALKRLRIITNCLGADGRAKTPEVLAAIEKQTGKSLAASAFREFRRTIANAAVEAGIELTLEADGRKGDRVWFSGTDPLPEQVAERSEREARVGAPKTAIPADARENAPYRLYISAPLSTEGQPVEAAGKLIKDLEDQLRTLTQPGFELASTYNTVAGEDATAERIRRVDEADAVVALLSAQYLASNTPEIQAVGKANRVVACFLEPLYSGADLKCFPRSEALWDNNPWSRQSAKQRQASLSDLIAAIHRELRRPRQQRFREDCDGFLETHTQRLSQYVGAQEKVVEAHASLDRFDATFPDRKSLPARQTIDDSAETGGRQVPAVERLLRWATAAPTAEPRFTALLGDVGMGKSTTVKELTLRLAERRRAETTSPLPILFDLRELEGRDPSDWNAAQLLDELLRRSFTGHPVPTGKEILSLAGQGNCVLLFDGLDEALVHLNATSGKRLIQRLWQIAGDEPSTRLLLSCRTHYFRTLREEISTFLSQGREAVDEDDYLVLHMLPFTPDQVRAYINGNVGPANAGKIMEMIGAVYNLSELAGQPMLLRMITAALAPLERRVAAGETLRSADLYQSFVEQWLARDDGKHQLLPDHKFLLMENLAAQLWRSGRRSWKAEHLENWLLQFLRERPEMELHYERRLPELWKEDLRTATFVTRSGNDFGFAHTSLLEFFLARHLTRLLALGIEAARDDWAQLAPSPETRRFMVELLLRQDQHDLHTCLDTLGELGRLPETGERVLRFTAEAVAQGLPINQLRGLQARGCDLSDLRLLSPHPLDLSGSDFTGAWLRRARFRNARFNAAVFTSAELVNASFETCEFKSADYSRTNLAGTTFRQCSLPVTTWEDAKIHHTHLIDSPLASTCHLGMEIAPALIKKWPIPATLTGHVNKITGGYFSPEGRLILTTSRDGTVRIWDAATGQPLHTLTGHTGWLTKGTFSPDGTRILTTSRDGTARIWDAATGQPLHTLTGHTGWLTKGTFSPDGTRILTTSLDGTARIWDAATGQPLHTLDDLFEAVTGGAFSPDGTRILTTSRDGTARIWDAATGQPLHTLTGHTRRVTNGSFSPDGTRILTTSRDGTAHIWDAATSQPLHTLTGHTGSLTKGTFSPDSSYILTTSLDGTARIWDAATGQPLHTLTGHTGSLTKGTFSPDSSYILTTSRDGTARIWDAATGQPLHTLDDHTEAVTGGAFSPDGTRILTTSLDGTARIWDAATSRCLHTLTGHTEAVTRGSFSPDGSYILTTSRDGTARIWDAATSRCLHTLTGHIGGVTSGSFSPDGTRILTTSRDGTVRIWDAATGQPLHTLTGHTGWLTKGTFSPDGSYILTTSYDDTARIWDAATGQPLHTLTGHTGWLTKGTFSPDGSYILTAGDDCTARIWDAATGQPLHTLDNLFEAVTGGAFSPDGTRILTTNRDGTARMWDAATGHYLHTLTGHIGDVTSGTFSPDGSYILTAGDDCTTRIWDAATGHYLHTLTGHTEAVTRGSFSPDGTRILTTSIDGTARIWDATTGRCLHTLTGHIGGVTSGSFSPDGTHILTTSSDGTARIWDAATGEQVGPQFEHLPEGELVVRDSATQEILGASPGAWRWLGIVVVRDGRPVRLPAEMGGLLPPLAARADG